MTKYKVGMVSLGCDKNRVDSEIMLGQVEREYELTNNPKEADIIIVNTCGFIEKAKQESINTILDMAKYKIKYKCKLLIATGCLTQRYGKELLDLMPELDIVLGVNDYEKINKAIEGFIKENKKISSTNFTNEGINEGKRIITTNKSSAYLRIAEGCNNFCTYCIIPKIRGKFRSRKIENIIEEGKILANAGVKEIILIAQDTTNYGIDLYNEKRLHIVLRELSKIEGIEFISPVLRTGENAENEIYQVCALLDSCGEYCDVETGGHIHIGADYLTNINAYKNLIEMWTNSEKILYIISNKEGEVPREVGEYAPPFSKKMKEAVEDGLEEENLEQFIEKIKEIQGERYSSINFLNIGDENKNTIEFRLSNGTIDPKSWIENINLFGGLIVAAQELSVIQERVSRGEEVTEQEKEKLSAFEKITTLEYTKENEEDKLKALLDLCINKNEQDIYLNRYAVNKELIKDREIVENVGVIRINRKQIGKLAFTGQEQINGVEYQQAQQIIEDDLIRDSKENNTHTISE